MFSPAHILSFICVNLGGAAWGLSFACVGALVGLPLSLALSFVAHDRKLLLLSPPGHSWDHMGWIEPRTASTSTSVQTG